MNMINKYKIQLYFLEQLTELRKIKQVTQKKKEAVCQEEKELIRQKNFLVPNPNDSYSRKKFKNLVGMTIGDIAKAYNVKVNDILELIKTKNPYTNSCLSTSKLEIRDLFINRSYFKGIISNYLSFKAQCKIQNNSFKGSSSNLVVREV
ncbi:hypothetical protein PDN68_014105 [Bacteroides hominis]|jgi:hypothetical protein|nr:MULTISPECIES: hypothetical protein [Bacteroides]MCE8585421.1 hypothetical protein [Bacteroides fragilis]MCS2536344.1 hypothetical protein [Bacteroides fragilis]MCS2779261.1 hypothetical protein [Bacteroides fragilis]MCS2877557.1 hypothetical protein [Bacteroides fragilis]MCS3146765.1 hypothetical protein [Bacteroides fragilis]